MQWRTNGMSESGRFFDQLLMRMCEVRTLQKNCDILVKNWLELKHSIEKLGIYKE